jgi:outer membrane protein
MPRPLLRTLVSALSLLALAAGFARGEDVPPPPAPALTLDEVIARAVGRNFDIKIQDYSVTTAVEALNVSKAAFEPTFTASSTRVVSQGASSINTLDGSGRAGPRNDSTTNQLNVTQFVPQTGGTVGVTTNLNRTATNSSFSTLNPAFANTVTLSASQPLLKGAGSKVAHANVDTNKLGVDIANLSYRSRVLQVVHDTEAAYYNLVFAHEDLTVKQHSLELAQKLYDENLTKKNTGVATDLDVLTAEVGVENARRGVIQATQSVHNAEDSLLNLIGPADFNTPVGSVTFPILTESAAPSFGISYKLALDNSPDYKTSLDTIKQLEISLAVAKQNRLPSLNLNGTLGYNANDATYGDALADLPNNHGNNWSLGLTFTVPWGLHADRARYRSAIASLDQQKVRLSQFEQNLVVSVRSDVRAVEVNFAVVAIAAKATELSVKNYELVKARFDAGLATSREVLQAQDDLESNHESELQAQIGLRNALSNLHQLEGSSLEHYKIKLPQQ